MEEMEQHQTQFAQLHNLVQFLSRYKTPRRDIPIVLVPGFAAWEKPLLSAFNYFGGLHDLTTKLTDMGWNVILPNIGPLSSNWERACEIYAQLTNDINKFGHVDYGKQFTASGGTNPFRERYSRYERKPGYKKAKPGPGVWVMPDDWRWGEGQQAHFVCHSQGGNTVRLLVELLRNGGKPDSYFVEAGRDHWVRSVTTLSTPHNGSTIIDIFNESGNKVKGILRDVICATSFLPVDSRVYDVQLDHWGIHRDGNEDFLTMLARMSAPDGPYTLWINSTLNAFYDNSIEGAAQLNIEVPAPSPNVHYFTMSFSSSVPTSSFKIDTGDIQTLIPSLLPVLKHVPLLKVFTFPLSWTVAHAGNRLGSFYSLLQWGVDRINARLPSSAIIPALWQPGTQLPRWDILVVFAPTCYGMGGYTLTPAQKAVLGPLGKSSLRWQENDGIVNTISQAGPWGLQNRIAPMVIPHNPEKGVFNNLGKYDGIDHADVIGINITGEKVDAIEDLFVSIANLLSYLD